MTKGKLFNLKKWLTVPAAAKHLSVMFEEDVSEADVLRLVLDGHLTLSVDFVNHASGRLGKVISYKEIEWRESFFERQCAVRKAEQLGDSPEGKEAMRLAMEIPSISIPMSLFLGGERYLACGKKVVSINGIWDLSMVGSERLDIEHEYQMLTDGPVVELTCLEGVLVEREGGQMCQLCDSFDQNEYQSGSTAQLEKIREHITSNNIGKVKSEKLLERHKKKRQEYLEVRKKNNYEDDYYPAGGLPKDSVLVVRTQALLDLQKKLLVEELTEENKAKTYINIGYLDEGHTFYADELLIAVKAWTELYEKNPPQHVPLGGHKKYIEKWLTKNYPSLSQRARDRITTVINPNPKGGASPTE